MFLLFEFVNVGVAVLFNKLKNNNNYLFLYEFTRDKSQNLLDKYLA